MLRLKRRLSINTQQDNSKRHCTIGNIQLLQQQSQPQSQQLSQQQSQQQSQHFKYIMYTNTPQDLVYNILLSKQEIYTKQELLEIIHKLHNMLDPQISGDCSYIS